MKLLHQGNQSFRLFQTARPDYPLHLHSAVEVVLLTEGSCECILENKRYLLSKGDLFIAFPNRIHGYENSKNTNAFVLIVPVSPYLSAFGSLFRKKTPVSPILSEKEYKDTGIADRIKEACRDSDMSSHPIMLGHSLIIIGKILQKLKLEDSKSLDDDALGATLIFINENYRKPLTRKKIAASLGYNESHLSHVFTSNLGTTLSDYIASVRIQDAIRLLSETDMSISQIAMNLGFGSIRSFNRAFRKNMGVSPSEFRKKATQTITD